MISQLSAKYHFGMLHTADTTVGKVTNQALLSTESETVHRLHLPIYGDLLQITTIPTWSWLTSGHSLISSGQLAWQSRCHKTLRIKQNVDYERYRTFFKLNNDRFRYQYSCCYVKVVWSIEFEWSHWMSVCCQPLRQLSDTSMLGEMMFGSVTMAYRGTTLKVHSIRYMSF